MTPRPLSDEYLKGIEAHLGKTSLNGQTDIRLSIDDVRSMIHMIRHRDEQITNLRHRHDVISSCASMIIAEIKMGALPVDKKKETSHG